MKAIIYPSICKGSVKIPPSKSLLHRYIILSSLAKGKSVIKNYTPSLDIEATINAFKKFNVKFSVNDDELIIDSSEFKRADEVLIDCIDSASTLRFLIPVLIHYANKVVFTGSKKLLSRPLDTYKHLFGDKIIIEEDKVIVLGNIDTNTVYVDGSISSQFISGLLFGLLLSNKPSSLIIQTKSVSKAYISLTLKALCEFGVNIKYEDDVFYIVPQELKPSIVTTEGDWSQASNFVVLSKINNHINLEGLNYDSIQADRLINELLDKDEIDLEETIDLGPILFAYYATLPKKTKFINTNRLIIKESNRIVSMANELKKFGVDVEVYDNVCFVNGRNDLECSELLSSHNDHRILMSLVILSTISSSIIQIDNIECVNKSYPNFFNDLRNLGIKIDIM